MTRTRLPLITVGFSSHRLEVLPAAREEMARHDAIALEEAPEVDFPALLAGDIAAADYLEDKDIEFHDFSLRQLELVRGLSREGKAIFQVEPYQERLIQIHELLSDGVPREKVENRPEFKEVYAAESWASRTLITFYGVAHAAPFPRVVAAVKDFARSDAARFRLRDNLRAQALAPLSGQFPRLYVEAGYIHLYLIKALAQQLPHGVTLKPTYLLASPSYVAINRPRPLGPGDLLTLQYIFSGKITPEKENLLAARSLIHIQLLEKGEMAPGADPAPHLTNEIRAYRLSGRLSYEDCAALYPQVRAAAPEEAVATVARYVGERAGVGGKFFEGEGQGP